MNDASRLDHLNARLAGLERPLFLARAAASLAVVAGLLTLAGWATGTESLIRVLPGLAPMKPMTALCFMLCGASLWLHCADSTRQVALARMMAALPAALGAIMLAEHLAGWDSGLDTLMFGDLLRSSGLPHPGRMTHAASLNFTLLGLALVFMDFEPWRGFRPAQHAALLSSLIGLIGLLGYAYGVPSLYGFFAYSSMALHTAFVFTFLGLGLGW